MFRVWCQLGWSSWEGAAVLPLGGDLRGKPVLCATAATLRRGWAGTGATLGWSEGCRKLGRGAELTGSEPLLLPPLPAPAEDEMDGALRKWILWQCARNLTRCLLC